MSNKLDGGPAFPINYKVATRGTLDEREYLYGMTLRDYFAAKAMQAYLQMQHPQDDATKRAYNAADSMLKARQS